MYVSIDLHVGLCQKVDNAVILLVGARFARPKTVCFVYYSQGHDRWFGQANPAPTVNVNTVTSGNASFKGQILYQNGNISCRN